MATLEQVIDWYDRGGGNDPKSSLLHPLDLSQDEKQDLLAFLESLNGKVPVVEKPVLPKGE
jgi:cytochrome c peroxidase